MTVAPFPTTRRSVILALSSADAAERGRAFDTLVACYWKPLYKYARVAWRRTREDAEDLTQSFFVRALEKESLADTMKLVRGLRLDAWAPQGHARTERLRLFARICEPVAFAHANGAVHRDLKPENVMVGEFGAVLVMDWGVEQIAGTPGYMPPERARGESGDARSDVYALGAMLQFLLNDEAMTRPLRAIIDRAMTADPSARYASAREIGDDVLAFLDGEPIDAYRENVFELVGRWLGRNRVLVALVLAYLIMRVIVFFWMRL